MLAALSVMGTAVTEQRVFPKPELGSNSSGEASERLFLKFSYQDTVITSVKPSLLFKFLAYHVVLCLYNGQVQIGIFKFS